MKERGKGRGSDVDKTRRKQAKNEKPKRTLTLLERVREKLEDPSHPVNQLDDSTSDKDRADLDGAGEDFGCGVGREGGGESGGDGGLMLLEEEGAFKVRVGGECEGLRGERRKIEGQPGPRRGRKGGASENSPGSRLATRSTPVA